MGAWLEFSPGRTYTRREFWIILLVSREGRKGAEILGE